MKGSREGSTNPSAANPDVVIPGRDYERNPDAEFQDNIQNTAAICNTASSHTYGNVLAVVEKYLLDLFPKDTFNTVTATTTLASRQVRHLPKQLYKQRAPLMVLAPRISFGQEDDRFLANTIMNSRITNTFANWGEGSLIPLADDKKNHTKVWGHYNRAVMYVDVVMTFNTYTEQVNWMSYIHNMIPVGHNFFIRAPLELYLPGEFCELLAGLAGKKVMDDNEKSVHDFLTHMNSVWYHPITYKLKGGSNRDAFFMYYLTDIDAVVTDPAAGPGVKDGQIRRAFDITFTVRCDFNTIGYFAVTGPNIRAPMNIVSQEDKAISTIFTDIIDLDNFQLPVGWSILTFPIFKLDVGERSISIDPVLNNTLRTVIGHHLKYGIPIERFLKIEFRENGVVLDKEAYYIDWVSRELIVIDPDYHRTYRLLISVSHEYVNGLVKELYNLE